MPDEVVYPKFQSTLLQEERPSSLSLYLSYCLISIHAPTRGATCNRDISVFIFIISIHAPTRGATVWRTNYIVSSLFQSTLLQEERRSSTVLFVSSFTISIHAPTRGATRLLFRQMWMMVFQSTLLQEERLTEDIRVLGKQ